MTSKVNGKVDLKSPDPIDHEKVEAFRRIVSAEDIEELGTTTTSAIPSFLLLLFTTPPPSL